MEPFLALTNPLHEAILGLQLVIRGCRSRVRAGGTEGGIGVKEVLE